MHIMVTYIETKESKINKIWGGESEVYPVYRYSIYILFISKLFAIPLTKPFIFPKHKISIFF